MMPTMLLFGSILGRWWRTCLWSGRRAGSRSCGSRTSVLPMGSPGAAGFAAFDTAVGVPIHSHCAACSSRYSRAVVAEPGTRLTHYFAATRMSLDFRLAAPDRVAIAAFIRTTPDTGR